jgi:hypothetical protein
MIVLFQKRETIESNHFLCDSVGSKKITNGFGNENDDLEERHVEECRKKRLDKLTIVGSMYVKAPVSSNMMTTTVTVILMTPLIKSTCEETFMPERVY